MAKKLTLLETPFMDMLHTCLTARRKLEMPGHLTDKVRPNERIVGTVSAPKLQHLALTSCQIAEEINASAKKHVAAHEEPNHTPEQCLKFHQTVERANKRASALGQLMWLGIQAEYPDVTDLEVQSVLREGWTVARPANKKGLAGTFTDPQHIFNTAFTRFEHIVRGKIKPSGKLPEAHAAPGEKVLGVINDSRTRALYDLRAQLGAAIKALDPNTDRRDPEQLMQWVRNQTLGNLEALGKQIGLLQQQKEVIDLAFWEAVRDELDAPEDPQGRGIGLRADWKVVELAKGPRSMLELLMPLTVMGDLSPFGSMRHPGAFDGDGSAEEALLLSGLLR